ncbi:hypothetical protein SAMN02990966_07752 [Rhodospirillales bacterium URHD0017]|nr:hypothetical protein SAMN02990966_07752 [Rhodospirillales bacterium URHD0017]
MTSGLLAPLSPPQEIALRRIAHGSFVVDARAAASLVALALVERTSGGLRLTPLGRLRYNALPKAPLLGHQRSIQAATGYVEGLIEKAQGRIPNRDMLAKTAPQPRPARTPAPAGLLLEAQDGGTDAGDLPGHQPIYVFFDSEHWRSRAERNLARTRQAIMEHRQRQIRLCDASSRCIESSRSLLRASVPVRPSWRNAAS